MKNNTLKTLLILILVLPLFVFITGCKGPDPQPTKYDVAYINDLLDATGFQSYFYQKTIKSGETLLLEENTNVILQDSKYVVKTEISKLATLDSTQKYIIEESEEEVEIVNNPISLEIKDEDFSSVEVTENSLTGNVKDDANVLGYAVKNLSLKINLSNSKVASIEVNYVDVETNLNVKVLIKYNY